MTPIKSHFFNVLDFRRLSRIRDKLLKAFKQEARNKHGIRGGG